MLSWATPTNGNLHFVPLPGQCLLVACLLLRQIAASLLLPRSLVGTGHVDVEFAMPLVRGRATRYLRTCFMHCTYLLADHGRKRAIFGRPSRDLRVSKGVRPLETNGFAWLSLVITLLRLPCRTKLFGDHLNKTNSSNLLTHSGLVSFGLLDGLDGLLRCPEKAQGMWRCQRHLRHDA